MRLSLERLTYGAVISTCLVHVFCCGIPLLLSAVNLAAVFGITSAEALHSAWFEQFEQGALLVSGVMLLATGMLQAISNRINCRTDGACTHEPCENKKHISKRVLQIAAVLYVANLLVYLLSH